MNETPTMEQDRMADTPAPEKRPRGRPRKDAPDKGNPFLRTRGIESEDHAENIVRRVAAHIAAGARPSRVVAQCESGISGQELESLLAQQHMDSAPMFGEWWNSEQADKHLLALEKWADDEDATVRGGDRYAETAVFRCVYGLLGQAHKARSLVAVTGLYGIGKSFAARQYVFDHPRGPNEAGAVWFEFPSTARGDTGVLDAILNALEPHSPARGSATAKLDRILSALKPGDFLIADECGRPAERGTGLRVMSDINEQAGVPVAMIGNPVFHTEVWGKRTDYDALASRTRHVALAGNDSEDIEPYQSWRGLTGRKWNGAMLTIARLPGRDGGLRAVDQLLDELAASNVELTAENFIGLAKARGRWAA